MEIKKSNRIMKYIYIMIVLLFIYFSITIAYDLGAIHVCQKLGGYLLENYVCVID